MSSEKNFQNSFKFKNLKITLCQESQRKRKPSDDDLIISKYYTDHMLLIKWSQSSGWSDPEIIPFQNLSLHPAAKVLQYANSIFEGSKAIRGSDGKVRLFRFSRNMARMLTACERSALPSFDPHELHQCIKKLIEIDIEWVPSKEMSYLYIRPTAMGIDSNISPIPSNEALICVTCTPSGPYLGIKPLSLYADPMHIRAWPGGVGNYKVSANYGPTLLIERKAKQLGHNTVLWLYGDEHFITEAGVTNVFVFLVNKEGKKELITPPLTDGLILPGITRESIIQIARDMRKFQVIERNIAMSELIEALEQNRLIEMFGTGNACLVCAIGNIQYKEKDYPIPTVQSDDQLYKKILQTLVDIQYGRSSCHSEWIEEVVPST